MNKHYFTGTIVVAIAVLIPLIWFIPIAREHDSLAALSQFLGSGALIVMAISMIISTRLPGTASIFGPLDRAYVFHKWLGVGSMAAILLHDTIDADMRELGAETFLVDLGETLGELSLYGLLALTLLSVATFTPYKLWKWTHRLMGAFFIAGAVHYLLILKPFQLMDPLGVYVAAFCIAGILAYCYATINGITNRGKRFKIVSAQENGNALTITLESIGKKLKVKPGQFAFLSIDSSPEAHPFTISGIESNGNIQFTIKDLGDYTKTLANIAIPGAGASVKGPFGNFSRRNGSPEIWIAAGVGITPFACWAQNLTQDDPPVHLFFSVRQRKDAPHLDELENIARKSSLTVHLQETESMGRLSIEHITSVVGDNLANATVSFCGPANMREDLKEAFQRAGLKAGNFSYEMFELRSGIGLRKLFGWFLQHVAPRALKAYTAATRN